MGARRRILSLHPAVDGQRAMFIGAPDLAKVEAMPVVCWALCEELAELPELGAPDNGGPTLVVAMVADVSAARLVFADSLVRFVGIASPHDSDNDWTKLVQRAAAARAQSETQLIEKVEQAADKAARVLSTLPPALSTDTPESGDASKR